jgi:glycosyltransferase involved in cell wall biosynthesis
VEVLFVSGEYPPDVGGVGDYTARLRSALDARGVPSRLLSRREVGRWDARALVRLLRAAPRRGIVHIQYQPAAFDLLGDVCLMPSLVRAARPRSRVVTTLHDARVPFLFPRAGALRWQAVRLLARTSHAVLAADERDLDAVGAARSFVVPIGSNVSRQAPPGYEREQFRAQLGLDGLAVAYFGLLNASKGLDVLFDAFERILLTRQAARLMVVGGSPGASDPTNLATAARVEARLVRLGDRVVRTGHVDDATVSAYLLAADVALLPYVDGASARRGSLLACAEHGLPIVSTQPAGVAVADAVLAVAAGDAEALAAAVLRVHDEPALAERLRAASMALAERVSWPRIAERHLGVYHELIG